MLVFLRSWTRSLKCIPRKSEMPYNLFRNLSQKAPKYGWNIRAKGKLMILRRLRSFFEYRCGGAAVPLEYRDTAAAYVGSQEKECLAGCGIAFHGIVCWKRNFWRIGIFHLRTTVTNTPKETIGDCE